MKDKDASFILRHPFLVIICPIFILLALSLAITFFYHEQLSFVPSQFINECLKATIPFVLIAVSFFSGNVFWKQLQQSHAKYSANQLQDYIKNKLKDLRENSNSIVNMSLEQGNNEIKYIKEDVRFLMSYIDRTITEIRRLSDCSNCEITPILTRLTNVTNILWHCCTEASNSSKHLVDKFNNALAKLEEN